MTRINTRILLEQLRKQVLTVQMKAENRFGNHPAAALLHAPVPGSWSAMQCLDHLNSYGKFYLPALDKAITRAIKEGSSPGEVFSPSWIGAKFTRMMQPGPDGELSSRMKSPKDHRPVIQPDAEMVLLEFIRQQETLIALLQLAEKVDIQKVKVTTSLSRFIRMSAGDTFSFLTAHINRHVLQAEKAIRAFRPVNEAV
ncbi:DinB family protein [Chitinophaga sp. Mgbs1]|uniref:DinB family protein n=1 Tax=Chitinophaga solisilvae TaxID=1233460 RepID=A0A433W8U0_9BACT|nr:DinB family protein [Chitinophaga solisilvae]